MHNYKCNLIFFLLILSVSVEAQVYGRLKANIFQTNEAVNSFNNVNMSAPTSATNLDKFSGEQGDRGTFQVIQSRIGGKHKLNDKVNVLMELDFVDFTQASPTTSSHPRLRRAFISHQVTSQFSLQFGQDWDLFGKLNPKVYNYIGNYFNAGNLGFMKNQLIGKYKANKNSYSFSFAQAGKNGTQTETELENKNRTSLTLMYEREIDSGLIDFTVVGSERDFDKEDQQIWGATLGFSKKYSSMKLIMELYSGEGLSKIALLTLPSTTYGHETGGFITSEFFFGDKDAIILGVGSATAENPNPSIYDSTNGKFTNLGAVKNTNIRVAYSHKLDGLEYYTEATKFITEYDDTFTSTSIEIGTLVLF